VPQERGYIYQKGVSTRPTGTPVHLIRKPRHLSNGMGIVVLKRLAEAVGRRFNLCGDQGCSQQRWVSTLVLWHPALKGAKSSLYSIAVRTKRSLTLKLTDRNRAGDAVNR
jgi:hypothetical protein